MPKMQPNKYPITIRFITHELKKLGHKHYTRETIFKKDLFVATYKRRITRTPHHSRRITIIWCSDNIDDTTITTTYYSNNNLHYDIRDPNFNPQQLVHNLHQWLTNPKCQNANGEPAPDQQTSTQSSKP